MDLNKRKKVANGILFLRYAIINFRGKNGANVTVMAISERTVITSNVMKYVG